MIPLHIALNLVARKKYYLKLYGQSMGLFKKKEVPAETKCKECGLELHDPVRLNRHMKKAHKHASQRNFDEPGTSTGGMW